MWSTIFLSLFLVLSANAFSKYGRSCKDIGCLNSEVCVLAEEPCSYGRTSECGSYPTCKKKTAADGGGETHNVPVTKTTPKPIAEIRPQHPPMRYDDDAPNYPAPAPPQRGSSFGNNGGGGNPYGTNSGGGGGNPYGTNSGGSGSNGNGFTNPFAGFNFGNAFGTNSGGGGSNGAGGGSNPISSILTNFLSNFTKGLPSLNPSFTRPGLIENKNSNPNPSNPYGNQPNPYQPNPYQPNPYGNQPNPYPNQPNPYYPNYPAYPSNGQNNPNQRQGYYPSLSQPSNGQASLPSQQNGYIAKNYGQSHASKSASSTRRPVSYGWSLGIGISIILLSQIFVNN